MAARARAQQQFPTGGLDRRQHFAEDRALFATSVCRRRATATASDAAGFRRHGRASLVYEFPE
jgi:hypothetical protein